MPLPMFTGKVNYKNSQLVTGVNGGLNSIGTATSIQDNQWSEHYGWNINMDGTITQNSGDWVVLDTVSGNYPAPLNSTTNLVTPFVFNEINQGTTYIHYPSNDKWRVVNCTTHVQTEYAYPTAGASPIYIFNVTSFSTQAGTYAIVAYQDKTASKGELSKMVYSGGAITSYIPPVWNSGFPWQTISHVNRIFAIVGNVLSWSMAGIWNDWYGSIPGTDGYVSEDNGYWVFERESSIRSMLVFNGALYLFGDKNIYQFSGYSPETFSSEVVLQNTGVYDVRRTCASNNAIYYFSDGEVWEYDGGGSTHSISSGQYVTGGIPKDIDDVYSGITMHFDGVNVIIHFTHGEKEPILSFDGLYKTDEYWFNTKLRTWSIQGATLSPVVETQSNYKYRSVIHDIVDMTTYFTYEYDIVSNVGLASLATYGAYRGAKPYALISKAFTNGSATQSALSNIWLQYKLSDITTATDITVSMSRLTTGDTDWTIVWHGENILGTGDIQTQRIMIPMNMMMTSEFYRIKIECSGALMTLYPYTREVRTKARG